MISNSRLETIVENMGFDCRMAERQSMAREILTLRATVDKLNKDNAQLKQVIKTGGQWEWNGNSSPAGHGHDDVGINPLHTK
ncbi:UNVERIFIED_CONTAM: hypothetical protein RF648_17575 [Kocuria sp. CPCC 205274]|uniref:Uncharacterized protein n=1 Tax=Herbiconiux daphne TaxID=2970914 RepID=A0ABT2H8V2_9MICO|nr:hypothetical protein [Herbiconiux daphne]MCS5736379.1 hypothetical protein [Herbiconiux daphne]